MLNLPVEMNVVEHAPGNEIYLCRSHLQAWHNNDVYFVRGRMPGLRTTLKLILARILK